jgi:hypothetical protein
MFKITICTMGSIGMALVLWMFVDSSHHTLTSVLGLNVSWCVFWALIFFAVSWIKVRAK